jgi:hypothetical protein
MTKPLAPGTHQRCKAHRKNGDRCKLPPIRGASVCGSHGGRAPQVRLSADQRMRDLVHPAITSLARLVEKDEFSATKYVLDWAGFRPAADQAESSEKTISVTVIFDHAESDSDLDTTPTLRLHDAR